MDLFYQLMEEGDQYTAIEYLINAKFIQKILGDKELEIVKGSFDLDNLNIEILSQLATLYCGNFFFDEMYQNICSKIEKKLNQRNT